MAGSCRRRTVKTQFAVGLEWPGHYLTVSIGEPADPAADVQVIAQYAARSQKVPAEIRGMQWDVGFNGFGANNEASSVSPRSLHRDQGLFLLGWASVQAALRRSGPRGRTGRAYSAVNAAA